MKNFTQMMKQAQELQGRMAEMQAEMERTIVEGRSGRRYGGGVAERQRRHDWREDRRLPLMPGEGEILEDLIVAAHADAKSKGRGGDEGEDEGAHRRVAASSRPQAVLMAPS